MIILPTLSRGLRKNPSLSRALQHGRPFVRFQIEPLECRLLLSSYSTILSFTGANGAEPNGGLVMDASGNLYGTTAAGGANADGEIYELAKGSTSVTILHSFNGADGSTPDDTLLIDGSGNLYGTTFTGGTDNIGTIFEYSTSTSTFTSLYSFVTPADGASAEPYAGLIMDSSGDLWGTTKNGGVDGHGSIFELAKSGSGFATADTLIYSFTGGNDGKNPYGGLLEDSNGDFFGVCRAGGADAFGTIWELASGATATTTLYTFTDGVDGKEPASSLIFDSHGDLIGTAQQGGATGRGDIFELAKSGSGFASTLTTLYSFNSNTDGQYPWGGPIMDSKGDLFGTVETSGATVNGSLWELPAGASLAVDLHGFTGTGGDGANSFSPVFMDPQGNLWGTTFGGGTSGDGTIFEYASSEQLVYAAQPGNTTAGVLPTINVDVEDQYGNLITTDTSSVTLNVHSGPGPITGTTTVAAVHGVASFTNAILATAGNYTLTATDGSDTPVTSSSFTVSPAPAAKLAFSVQPSTVTAGVAESPSIVVDVENSSGGIVTTDSSSVTLAVASGPGSLTGTLTVNASSGVATFSNVKIDTSGAYTITATDGSLTSATSGSFTVNPAAAAALVFAQQPSTVGTNTAISPAVTVDVEDAFGNLVTGNSSIVTMSKASGPGSLGGTLTAAVSSGVATFGNLSLNQAGTYTLTATDGSLTHATSSSFTVNSTGSSKLAFAQQPTNVFAGSAESPSITVDVEDVNGNIVTSDNSSVTLSVASGGGSLSGTVTVSAVSGVATFSNIEVDTAGAYTLSATDGSLTSATSGSFTVSPAAAAKLVYGQQPTAVMVNTTISPAVTVKIEDQFGNLASTNSSNVTLAVASGPGTLSGTLTVAAVNGVATFSDLSVNTAGSYTLSATDGSLTSATSSSFTVSANSATKLAIATQPSNVVAGATMSPAVVVDLENASGSIVTSDTSSVTLAVASGPGSLGGTVTVQAVSGVATFSNLSLDTAGSYTLTATDGSLTHATTSSFTVSPAAASKVVYGQQPTTVTVNTAISPAVTVKVEDQYGNVLTSNTSNVTIAIASGPGTLSGTLTVAALNGVATFSNLKLDTAGTYTLTATDGSLTSATSSSFGVNTAPAAKLAIIQEPTSITAGATISPAVTVDVEDASGDVITTNTSSVTLAIATGPGSLGGTVTVQAVNGVATFNSLTLDTAGSYTLNATDGSLTHATSSAFTVSPAAATKLAFTQQPSFVTINTTITPAITVSVEDQFGNVITSNSSTVTIAKASGPGTLSGTLTAAASNGVATFSNLSVNTEGNYTLQATDGSLTSATSNSFAAGTISNLVVVDHAPNSTQFAKGSVGVTVAAENENGDLVTNGNSTMTAHLFTSRGNLVETLSASVVSGLGHFNIPVPTTEGKYTLSFTDGSITINDAATVNVNNVPLNWQWWGGSVSVLWSGRAQGFGSVPPVAGAPAPAPAPSGGTPGIAESAPPPSGTSTSQSNPGGGNDMDMLDALFGVPLSRRLLD